MSEVAKAIEYLNRFAERENIYLFNNIPQGSSLAVDAPNDMNIEQFLYLAKALNCKILYYEVEIFTGENLDKEQWAAEKEEEDNDDELDRKLNNPISLEIVFYHNDIAHKIEIVDSWFIALEEREQERRSEEAEALAEKMQERFEQNRENWCDVVGKDKQFQRAKSLTTKATIILELFPEIEEYAYSFDYLVAPKYHSVIDMIIQNSTEIADGIIRDQVLDLHSRNKSGRSIAGILDISEHRVRRILAKFNG